MPGKGALWVLVAPLATTQPCRLTFLVGPTGEEEEPWASHPTELQARMIPGLPHSTSFWAREQLHEHPLWNASDRQGLQINFSHTLLAGGGEIPQGQTSILS